MSPFSENDVLSKVELVLPRNVVETCYLLPTGVGTEFLSSNIGRATVTRTHVFKADDESVRIHITVSTLQVSAGHHPEYVMIQNVKKKCEDSQHDQEVNYQNALTLVPVNVDAGESVKKSIKSARDSHFFPDVITDLNLQVQPTGIVDSTSAQIFVEQILEKDFCEGISAVESLPSAESVTTGGFESQDVNGRRNTEDEQLPPDENQAVINTSQIIGLRSHNHLKRTGILPKTLAVETTSSGSEVAVAADKANVEDVTLEQVAVQGKNEAQAPPGSNCILAARVCFEKCVICGLEVKDLEALREHLLSNHNHEALGKVYIANLNRKLKVKCQICHEECFSQRLLDKHMATVHLQEKELKCDQCGLVLDSEKKYEKHMQSHQQGERFLCHLCPSSFKVHSYLLSHLKHVHVSGQQNFKCERCDKSFTSEKYLYNHNLRVHGQKKYVCSYCNKGFTNATNKDRHITLVHERAKIKGHACPFCERFFSLKFNMMDHIKTVHKQEFSHSCELCGAGFRRQSEVVTHKKAIHGDSKVKFASPVKRKPGRPNRSGSRKVALAGTSPAKPVPRDAGKKVFMKDSGHNVEGKVRFIQASPEMIRTLGIAPSLKIMK